MRHLLLCLWAALPALAQFVDLAPNANGSEALFVTTLRQRGTDQPPEPKLFRMRGQDMSLLLTRECEAPAPGSICGLSDVQVSGDGTVLTFQSRITCIGGSSCLFRELSHATLMLPGMTLEYPGRVRISRNGRFLVQHGTGGFPGFQLLATLREIPLGLVANLGVLSGRAVRVSHDGTVLTSAGQVVNAASSRLLTLPERSTAIDMDDSARFATAQSTQPGGVWGIDIAADRSWLISPAGRDSFDSSISADGQFVLYRSNISGVPQAFFNRIDGSVERQLTTSGAQGAALSHDGRSALILTGAGALLRVDTLTGAEAQILGPAPHDLKLTGAPVPGSLNILTGIGLAAEEALAESPLREELAGLRATLDGTPLLLQYISPATVLFQIPWEAPFAEAPRKATLALNAGNEQFEAALPVTIVAPGYPQTFAFVHQDFQSLVTPESPAAPGEFIHLYASGLGHVSPSPASGEATPIGPLSRVTTPWRFYWSGFSPDNVQADVPFAGLAPGMVGVYQVDIRVPDGASRSALLWTEHPAGAIQLFANIPVQH